MKTQQICSIWIKFSYKYEKKRDKNRNALILVRVLVRGQRCGSMTLCSFTSPVYTRLNILIISVSLYFK